MLADFLPLSEKSRLSNVLLLPVVVARPVNQFMLTVGIQLTSPSEWIVRERGTFWMKHTLPHTAEQTLIENL